MSLLRLTIIISGLIWNSGSVIAANEPEVLFNQSIRPILSDKCFVCHGPDSGSRQADLRLDTAAGAYAALTSSADHFGIVPGSAEKSVVFQRVITTDDTEKMPPVDSNLSLTQSEIETLKRWIEQGAEYQAHWSVLAPQRAQTPGDANLSWRKNWIDDFVSSQQTKHGLQPNPTATKEQLLRRASLDLTGLPPTLEEIDAFLGDHSDQAFEVVIDRLLASPRFGERMAAEWLDVARYSDTYGFQVDRERFVWPWRDWVVRAFNRNLPYDEFIVQQLAGDLLPGATNEEILATTFCRLHPQETEGGSVPEEYRVEYVADRAQTVATAFMGMTLECCRCHDHKYDPISQKEYFQLFAYFDDIDEAGLYSYFTDAVPTPTLQYADAETLKKQSDALSQIQIAEEKLEQFSSNFQAPHLGINETVSISGELLHLDLESVAAPNKAVTGVVGQAALLTGDDPIGTNAGNFHRYDPFSFSLWISVPDHKERAVILHRSMAWTDAGSRGYELLLEDGCLSVALVHFDPGNSIRIRANTPTGLNQWTHISVTYDGSSHAHGLTLYVDGKQAETTVIRDQLTREITGGGGDNITLGERMRDSGFKNGSIDEFRLFNRQLFPEEVQLLAKYPDWKHGTSLAQLEADGFPSEQFQKLKILDSADYLTALENLRTARKTASDITESIPEIMVMKEMPQPKRAFVLTRGEYQNRAEEVFAKTPDFLPAFLENSPQNRLGLAQWLTMPGHPLTSRTTVNRYWQMLFGAGLVRTPEDFGLQGQWPTHPELLDSLAFEFEEHDWDLKWLLKEIMLSATYQQSATVTPEAREHDPENLWLTRMSGARLPAEMLRDQVLFASGLLVEKVGGPPVKPYELSVAFKPLTIDSGENLYRRSLYTFWTRTGPAPVMMTLDAAKRDVCQVRRDQTLSPLQPLVLLNGPQFVEAARGLALKGLKQHPDSPQNALSEMFRSATSRAPSAAELNLLTQLYNQQVESFTDNPESVTAYLSVGELKFDEQIDPVKLAALSTVASMIFNLDDFLFKR